MVKTITSQLGEVAVSYPGEQWAVSGDILVAIVREGTMASSENWPEVLLNLSGCSEQPPTVEDCWDPKHQWYWCQ